MSDFKLANTPQPVIPTKRDFVIRDMPMLCGQEEAAVRTYHQYIVGEGPACFFVADQPNAGDNVYYWDGFGHSQSGSQGFSGAIIPFTLVDGTIIKAKAPWHSNSDALFELTGIDVRDKHLTFCALSIAIGYTERRRVENRWYDARRVLVDCVYRDLEPVIGSFHRWKTLLHEFPEAKYYYAQSQGGSISGPIIDCDRDNGRKLADRLAKARPVA